MRRGSRPPIVPISIRCLTKHLSTSAPPSVPPWDFPIAPLVKDTELMELASDGKLKEIGEFCGWWGREVSPRELLGRKPVTDQLQGIDVAEWKMRVSRWGNRLKDYERYKADIILA